MSDVTEKITSFVSGVLAGIQPDDDEPDIRKVEALLSVQVDTMQLSAVDLKQLARQMVVRGFEDNPCEFVLAFSRYLDLSREDEECIGWEKIEKLDQYMLEAIARIRYILNSDEARPNGDEIEASVAALMLFSNENRGSANQLIRLCGQKIDYNIVDQYCENHPYVYSPYGCYADEVRELLLQGLFRKFGFWHIWCMIRRFFLGKNPAEAKVEMEKEKEIIRLRALLEGSWKHGLVPNDADSKKIDDGECALFQRLIEIDPDWRLWMADNDPAGKRDASTEIGKLINQSL